jgi:predicted enzyme related to lactoylglutathione lyase
MTGIVQVAQHAVDLDRARDFYAALLDSAPTAEFRPPGLVFFDLEGVRLLLDEGAPSALIYLRVPDLDAVLARCRRDGVEVVSDPHVIFSHADDTLGPAGTDEWMAFLKDSEGNTVALVSQRPPG